MSERRGQAHGHGLDPALHPPLTVSDENGQATTEALRRSALEGIQALSETEDPAQIGRMLADLRNAETLFSDAATRERVKTVLARAKEIKTASEAGDQRQGRDLAQGRGWDKTAHMNKTADAIREKVTAKVGMAESMRGLTHTITFTSEDLRGPVTSAGHAQRAGLDPNRPEQGCEQTVDWQGRSDHDHGEIAKTVIRRRKEPAMSRLSVLAALVLTPVHPSLCPDPGRARTLGPAPLPGHGMPVAMDGYYDLTLRRPCAVRP